MAIYEQAPSATPYQPLATPSTHVERQSDPYKTLRGELDHYYAEMKQFPEMDLRDVLVSLAAWSARAAEIRGQLHRSDDRRSTALRAKEIEPFLEQCEYQFKVYSRIQSIRDMEFRISGGGV